MYKAQPHVAIASIVLISLAMVFAYQWSPNTFDWQGYRMIYDSGGAWLARDGRDLGFVFFVDRAFAVFGDGGYERFRFVLGAAFVGFAGWLAWIAPAQRIGIWQIPAVAAVVLAAFLLKSSIQIREGLAFGLVIISVINLYRGKNYAWTFIPLLIGLSMHTGMAPFVLALVAAYSSVFLLELAHGRHAERAATEPGYLRLLFGIGIALGVFLAVALANFSGLAYALTDFGVYQRTTSDTTGLAKAFYWTVTGVLVFMMRQQLVSSMRIRMPKAAFTYTQILSSVMLPGCYALVVILLLTGQAPVVVSFAGRMLVTLMHAGLVILVLRGRAGFATTGIALWMLADAIRLYGGALIA